MSVPALVAAKSFLVPIPRLFAGTIGRPTLHPRLPDEVRCTNTYTVGRLERLSGYIKSFFAQELRLVIFSVVTLWRQLG
jgi:hypothetical protein